MDKFYPCDNPDSYCPFGAVDGYDCRNFCGLGVDYDEEEYEYEEEEYEYEDEEDEDNTETRAILPRHP